MRKLFSILFLFCVSAQATHAVDVNAVHFRSAGVDVATQKYLLQWSYPNPNDTLAIKNVQVLMYATDEFGYGKLATVDTLDNQVTQYIDNKNSCCAPPIMYALRLIDTGTNLPATTDLFCTMQLSAPTLDTCANTINLQWSAYQKFVYSNEQLQPVVEFSNEVQYHIYGYVGGNIFKRDSMVWLASAGSATSYALPVVREKKYHHLLIAAVYNNGQDTSFSNRVPLYAALPLRPQYIAIDSLMVNEESTKLCFQIDPATEYAHFFVEKSNDINVGFEKIEEFFNKNQRSVQLGEGGNTAAFYRVSAVNSCGRVTVSSPVATALGVNVHSEEKANSVSWNSIRYNGFDARYNVYRTAPSELATSFYDVQNIGMTDDLSLLPDSVFGAEFCYVVEAVIQNNELQNICYVRSAEECSSYTPQAHMPNAIQLSSNFQNPTTGKSRNLFEPVSSSTISYTLNIYARSGRQIYSGSASWNGRENNTGEFVNEGSYAYFVKIFFANGKQIEKTGNVTVVY
ncbi:MAG: hypothetical protein LBU92_04800 [Prevotellaceae bacterium]|jgi:hypothetical protein|nr:hypothetical protein [Prevotellaceae bacterium]